MKLTMNRNLLAAGVLLALLAGCTTIPEGPSLYVLPGTGKSFEQFRFDDANCRDFALSQVGGTRANEAAVNSGITSAAVGTAVGAVAGAAIGGGNGAAVGAGTGLAVGALAGTGAGQASGHGLQRRYDNSYGQCMYAKGHKVPVSAQYAASLNPQASQPARAPARPPAPGYYPPPPPPPPYR